MAGGGHAVFSALFVGVFRGVQEALLEDLQLGLSLDEPLSRSCLQSCGLVLGSSGFSLPPWALPALAQPPSNIIPQLSPASNASRLRSSWR